MQALPSRLHGEIAQLVEHTTENRGVPGSSPGLAIRESAELECHDGVAVAAGPHIDPSGAGWDVHASSQPCLAMTASELDSEAAPSPSYNPANTGISLTTDDIDAAHEYLKALDVHVDEQVSRTATPSPQAVLVPRCRRQHAC
jgi:hypothetical protein